MWHLPETLMEFEEAGECSVVLELIDSFQTDTASRLERLHNAVARFDAATVKAEAHSVRGSARQMDRQLVIAQRPAGFLDPCDAPGRISEQFDGLDLTLDTR